jgi:membrane protein YdbS with pleckstrin-like domain
MSERAPQSEPRKAKTHKAAPAAPGIINDLPDPASPTSTQSMIINDLRPSPASPPAQQMIINDLAPEAGRGGQQMIVNDVPMPDTATAAQQMVVNDMAFSDLVKGLEALTRGELPAGSPAAADDPAAAPAPRVTARAAPIPGPAPARPALQANQPRPSPVPLGPDGQPVRTVRKTLAQPGSIATGPSPLAPSPLQPQAADLRTARPQAAAQPMVINTPQPLVKPRREDRPEPAQRMHEHALPQRLAPDARTSAATMEAVTIPLTPPKNTTQAAGKQPQKKEAAARSKPANPDEWNATYAGRTMLPSLMACLALTAGVVGLSVRFLPEEWLPLVLFTTLGFIWMTQLVRWAYRVMLFRYRLTRQHLHLHRGLLYGRPVQVPLDKIAKVSVSANLVEKILGVGTVRVEVTDHTPAVVELEGIRQPREVVQKLERK